MAGHGQDVAIWISHWTRQPTAEVERGDKLVGTIEVPFDAC